MKTSDEGVATVGDIAAGELAGSSTERGSGVAMRGICSVTGVETSGRPSGTAGGDGSSKTGGCVGGVAKASSCGGVTIGGATGE